MIKLKDLWSYVIGFVGLLIAGLVYYLGLKNRQINALQAQVDLADTANKVTALETEIKFKRDNVSSNTKEVIELDKTLKLLEEKKVIMAKEAGAKTSQQIEEFWNEKVF